MRYLVAIIVMVFARGAQSAETPAESAPIVFKEAAFSLPLPHSQSLTSADLNGDGKMDLVVSSANRSDDKTGGHIAIFFQKDKRYAERPDITIDTERVFRDLATADFDRDGKTDLIGRVGKCTQIFPAKTHWSPSPERYVRGVVSGVGGMRVAQSFRRPTETLVALGPALLFINGGKTAARSDGYVNGPERNDNGPVIPYDINRDGDLDMVALSRAGGAIRVYYGPFCSIKIKPSECAEWTLLPCPKETGALAIGDLNGDGMPDIVAAGAKSSVAFFQARPMGFPGYSQQLDVGGRPLIADLDRDGTDELAFLSPAKRALLIYRAKTTPGEQAKNLVFAASVPVPYGAAVFSDINNDSRPDFIVGDDKVGVRFFLNASDDKAK